ncbi:tRNA (adenosine(37)-N6)-dimethylallyltransferase MiaA [Neolewinella lacunae]|uniref:tRNA dimethylallyltransferase n=1 Tax=Neolewinella lacunae TaxID=1517758 RepID=A0A923T8A3_9BACT|nr:tRNA (adenosine(37)-N6)-dimethylallyltransferase MiaA [Neolewinella lacunae]MBC6995395.1 tRNA (adenosine(37)-N6)-dimethylallyltransferase MiaA [Neolewinella lacunae]MDN3633107.1 tRNA (adenosine(37)-N6)-dimethylallyltransferase MiaA [Neolewinella lacunae]
MEKKTLIVIGGPTASGKTGLAIAVAQHFGTEIISGDSRQFYREMTIGNARPTDQELALVRHHFIADRSLLDPLSAGRFAEEALQRLHTIFESHPYAVLVGGSGLYLRALCEGLDEFPEVTEGARSQVQSLLNEQGLPGLQAELSRLDPAYYAVVDRANPRRLERALQVCYASGQPYSSFLGQTTARPFRCLYLRAHPPREALYARIDARVDAMLAAGLEAEVQSLAPHQDLPVLQTVGYQEWWPYLRGEYDRATAIDLVKRNSRRYAKRQVTWFSKDDQYRTVAGVADVLAELKRL